VVFVVSVGEQFFGLPGCSDDDEYPNHDDAVNAIEPNLEYTGKNAHNP